VTFPLVNLDQLDDTLARLAAATFVLTEHLTDGRTWIRPIRCRAR
jgi:hypothetical protein